jgi:hypothetical protein
MPMAEGALASSEAAARTGAASAAEHTLRPARPGYARELQWWALIAVGALALAGLFALLLAVSRIPGIEAIFPWPVGFFHKGLVIHVVFSFVVWFLAVFGALAALARGAVAGTEAGRWGDRVGHAAAALCALAMPLLFVPALLDRGAATLNNYVPTIVDPLYYAGLAVLFFAVSLVAARALVLARRPGRLSGAAAAIVAAAVAYLGAMVCLIAAWAMLDGRPLGYEFNEDLFWGGGHVLQIANTALLIAAWAMLLGAVPGARALPRWPMPLAAAALALTVVPALAFYARYEPFSGAQYQAFTDLQYAFGPPALLAAACLLAARPRPWPWRHPAALTLALSMLLFAVGGAFGFFVDGGDTRTPAHYHGVIAAVTLAFMTLFYQVLLPRLGAAAVPDRWQRRQIHLFAWGQLVACIGLFVAGGHGAPRKVAGAEQGLDGLIPVIGLGLNGAGGLVAVIGGVIFVVLVARALARRGHGQARTSQSHSGAADFGL